MLNVKALSLTAGILWALCLFLVALLNSAFPGYGGAFLDLAASIYPGYNRPGGIGSAVVVGLYGLVDGAVSGAILAWLYNRFARRAPSE